MYIYIRYIVRTNREGEKRKKKEKPKKIETNVEI